MYAYSYTLCDRAVVATFDLSASNLDAFETDHWLKNELNVIVLRLTEKAFTEPTSSGVLTLASGGQAPCPTPMPGSDVAVEAVMPPRKRRWASSPKAVLASPHSPAHLPPVPALPLMGDGV